MDRRQHTLAAMSDPPSSSDASAPDRRTPVPDFGELQGDPVQADRAGGDPDAVSGSLGSDPTLHDAAGAAALARPTVHEGPADHATREEGPETRSDDEELHDRIQARLSRAEQEVKSDALIGSEIAGRFTISAKIGEGGMGAVYKARQRGMDRDVAIKVLLGNVARNEVVVKRFHLEALAVSKLKHPNTIQIFDFGETAEGRLYIAMEFLDGVSLHEVLKRDRVLSVRRALNVAGQMAKSLREAHAKGIVHRDLKPDNIFLCTVGEETDFVKVLDFGVAKLRDDDKERGQDLTKTGTIFGTPKYMSPEQARAGTIDPRSDIYAIGVILFEMLTGRAPFDADSSLGILIKHIQEPVPFFEDVQPDLVFPEEVKDLVYRCLAKKPDDRPQSAEALVRELAKAAEGLDEIYRNVLTRGEAVKIGLELALSPRTRHDTRLNTAAQAGLQTVGPFSDRTLDGVEVTREPPRRWPIVGALVVVLLLGGVAAAAGTYASLERLPAALTGFDGLTEVTVLPIPEATVENISIGVFTEPAGVVVSGLVEGVDDPSAFNIVRPKGAKPVELTFSKEGYKDYRRTFEFSQPSPPVKVTLVPINDVREVVVENTADAPPPRPPRPRPSTSSSAAADPEPKRPSSGLLLAPEPKPRPATSGSSTPKPEAAPPKATTTPPPKPASDSGKLNQLKGVDSKPAGGGLKL